MSIEEALAILQQLEEMLNQIGGDGRLRVFNALMTELFGTEIPQEAPNGKPSNAAELRFLAFQSLMRYVEASGTSRPIS